MCITCKVLPHPHASVLIYFVSLFSPNLDKQANYTHTHTHTHTNTLALALRFVTDPGQAATIMATRDNYFDYSCILSKWEMCWKFSHIEVWESHSGL